MPKNITRYVLSDNSIRLQISIDSIENIVGVFFNVCINFFRLVFQICNLEFIKQDLQNVKLRNMHFI